MDSRDLATARQRAQWLFRERARLAGYGIRFALGRLVRFTGSGVARHIRRRADAARDAQNYQLAGALYEEALRFVPGDQRTHVQAGHMFKEAGDLAAAERHYREAERVGPRTADLALQLGHFLKVAGRPDEAEASYAQALMLRPGWTAAADELARIGGSIADDHEVSSADLSYDPDLIVPELLPRAHRAPTTLHDTFQVRRLGASRLHSRWGLLKVLRGVEAVRGYCVTTTKLDALHILVGGSTIHIEPLRAFIPEVGGNQRTKFVFNAWCDFAAVAPGRNVVELRLIDERGRTVRAQRETVLIAEALSVSDFPHSDALVIANENNGTLPERINSQPSIIRSTRRQFLPHTVRTILVQRVDQLGDLVCSIPAIRRLRELFPEAALVGLVTEANADFARVCGLFEQVIVADFRSQLPIDRRSMPLAAQEDLRRRLANFTFDMAIDLGEGAESRPLLLLSGAPFLAGFKDREFPWLSAGFDFNAHDPVNRLEIMPPARKMLALVEALGAMLTSSAVTLTSPHDSRAYLNEAGLDIQGPYLVLHAGARLDFSRWPHFEELARLLLQETTLSLVVFTESQSLRDQLRQHDITNRVKILEGHLPFQAFEAVLRHCAAFVGNDSGPKHLAALYGVPVVSIHMARLNWSEWGQEGTGTIISRRVPCAGCGISNNAEECGKDFSCLVHIKPSEVFDAILKLL